MMNAMEPHSSSFAEGRMGLLSSATRTAASTKDISSRPYFAMKASTNPNSARASTNPMPDEHVRADVGRRLGLPGHRLERLADQETDAETRPDGRDPVPNDGQRRHSQHSGLDERHHFTH